jgi:nucleotide-binding universal stress UspA family protein
MRQLKRIIVGHDLGVGGEVALRSAVVLANRCDAALRLVHVVEPLDAYQRISHPLTSPFTLEEIAQKTGARLQALAVSPELARLQVEYEVRKGKPFVELIIAGRAWLADLIVVGGASRTEEPFLGSTSERVLRKALVPVMVAKKPLSSEVKTFLVPTDFSSCARKAAEEALMLAKNFSARVIFFHALDLAPSYTVAYAHDLGVSVPISPPSPEEIEPEWKAFLSGLPLDNVDWEKSTEEGQAATAIVHRAKRIQADMIVIGTHGRSGLAHMLLGSVAEKVVRTASCPVLSIRPEAFKFELP